MSSADRDLPTEEVLELVYEEFLARRATGQRPSEAEFIARYPQHREAILQLFALHRELGELLSPEHLTRLARGDRHATSADLEATSASEPGAALEAAASMVSLPEQPRAGAVIGGRFKLLQIIGEGGMGAVWMAEQRIPVKRMVALKLVKPGMDSRAVLARFEAERQALALMDHPNIAKVLDGGTTPGGRPFFVMELVRGVPLMDYCDQRHLNIAARLNLFMLVCSAVQHAHQKGIIHRDLKSSNVLVTEHDGHAVPKVIDFGLAKAMQGAQSLTDNTLFTAFGAVVGTPLYMAPEQVGINALDVDTRTDVYALGVLLYELLTGTTPLEKKRFKEAAWEEIRRLIREEEPPRPSMRLSSPDALPSIAAQRGAEPGALSRQIRGDLDGIVMKALEKDRSRRYDTANGFSRDVQRFLSNEPVEACPPTVSYLSRKFFHRHRAATIVSGTLLAAILLGTLGTTWMMLRAMKAEAKISKAFDDVSQEQKKTADALIAESAAKDEAAIAEKSALLQAANATLDNAQRLSESGEANVGLLWMARAHELALRADQPDIADAARAMISGWLNQVPRRKAVLHEPSGSCHLDFGPDQKTVLAAALNKNLHFGLRQYDLQTGKEIDRVADVIAVGQTLAVNPEGTMVLLKDTKNQSRLWSVKDRKWMSDALEVSGVLTHAQFSPDGLLLASITEKAEVRLFHAADGKPTGVAFRHDQGAYPAGRCRLAFTPDSQQLWTVNGSCSHLASWDVKTGKAVHPSTPQHNWMPSIAISSSGQYLAVSANSGFTKIFSLQENPARMIHHVKFDWSDELQFTPDSRWLVEGARNGKVGFRSVITGQLEGAPVPVRGTQVNSVRVNRQQDHLLLSYHQAAEVWELAEFMQPSKHFVEWTSDYRYTDFAPNRKLQIGLLKDSQIVVRRLDRNEEVKRFGPLDPKPWNITIAPDDSVAVFLTGKGLTTLDLETLALTPSAEKLDGSSQRLVVARGGKTAMTITNGVVQLWSLPEGRFLGNPLPTTPVKGLLNRGYTFSDDGSRCGALDGNAHIYHVLDCRNGTSIARLALDAVYLGAASLSPNGQYAGIACGNRVRIWD